jgi:hypothetical protein
MSTETAPREAATPATDGTAGDLVARTNGRVHGIVILILAITWLGFATLSPQREGLAGLGDGIILFLSGGAALAYAVISTIALALLARRRHAALLVHLSTLLVILGALATTVAFR